MFDDVTVQDLMMEEFFSDGSNETVDVLSFIRDNSVTLSKEQLLAVMILKENDLDDVANYALNARRYRTPFKKFIEVINSLTMADRIKGNAKLSSILKANANPANTVYAPNADLK